MAYYDPNHGHMQPQHLVQHQQQQQQQQLIPGSVALPSLSAPPAQPLNPARAPFDPTAHDLSADFRLTSFAGLKG